MEQGTVSTIPSTTIPDNSVGKQKSIGISINPGTGMQAATEKLKDKWLRSLLREDATGWEIFMFGLAEVIGTALLVFIGCTGCIGSMTTPPSMIQTAMAFGLGIMVAIQCVGHVSGAHINPCVTIASLILGKKSLPMCLFYIVCQCLGGLLGYALLKVITPDGLIYNTAPEDASTFCITLINPKLSIGQAFLAEFLGTAILILFVCGVWDYRNADNTDSVPIRFAFCIIVLCLVLIPYTGCSVNPARTFGPAVWNNYWKNHWVYWVAPITGAITAAIFYRCVFEYKEDQDYTVNS